MSVLTQFSDAQDLLDLLSSGDCAAAKTVLSAAIDNAAMERLLYANEIEKARALLDDDLEIDHEPYLSASENGVWVSAWIYVPIEQQPDDEDEE